jgi:alkanesulfonate monooxygenase SsuD/methylene tetrahydromethanopterin reductase-like flavin-dependent oxidoreductase (luciferase family)
MECDYRPEVTQQQAFDEAFHQADTAEELGFDGVWLAERHFATPWGAAGVASIVSAPMVLATAIAVRTSSLRVGIGVLVLPLGHPVRMAEEVATLDNICQGRFDLGVGRSGFARAYEGYDLPYGESRSRFLEYLEVMRRSWTEDTFSHAGDTYTFNDVSVIPKPYQKPYPPLWAAATTRETFSIMGGLGLNILVGLRGMTVSDLVGAIGDYRASYRQAGYAGDGKVMLRVPVYVADNMERALSEPRESAMRAYARLQQAFTGSIDKAGSAAAEERSLRAESLATVSFDDLLRERLAYGTPRVVVDRLVQWRDTLGLSGFIMEPNVGGQIPQRQVLDSIRLFAEEVVPELR